MIEIRDLSFRYSRRTPYVFKDLSFSLSDGEVGILLGKNGAGKTTLFQCILGICKPESGTILFDGEDLLKMTGPQRARRIAYVPQHIHFGALTVFDSILSGRVSGFGFVSGKNDTDVVERIIEEMHLEELAYRSAEELSGGEKQKVAIARALAQEPKMLVFDEPTGNLDLENEELVIEEARRLAKNKNITVLSSIHDINRALYFGDRFFFLSNEELCASVNAGSVTPELVKAVFNVDMQLLEVNGKKFFIGGKYYEN